MSVFSILTLSVVMWRSIRSWLRSLGYSHIWLIQELHIFQWVDQKNWPTTLHQIFRVCRGHNARDSDHAECVLEAYAHGTFNLTLLLLLLLWCYYCMLCSVRRYQRTQMQTQNMHHLVMSLAGRHLQHAAELALEFERLSWRVRVHRQC